MLHEHTLELVLSERRWERQLGHQHCSSNTWDFWHLSSSKDSQYHHDRGFTQQQAFQQVQTERSRKQEHAFIRYYGSIVGKNVYWRVTGTILVYAILTYTFLILNTFINFIQSFFNFLNYLKFLVIFFLENWPIFPTLSFKSKCIANVVGHSLYYIIFHWYSYIYFIHELNFEDEFVFFFFFKRCAGCNNPLPLYSYF